LAHVSRNIFTDSDILFVFLLTNVLIVRRFGLKRLLNALNVNVNIFTIYYEAFIQRNTQVGLNDESTRSK
jgi:hypothetical protein